MKNRPIWKENVSTPENVLENIKPGMRIFIGTGVSEPLTLVRYLKGSNAENLLDLELFQLVSLGEAIEVTARHTNKYRLKTFFSGWESREAVSEGFADFIPSRYYQIPAVFRSGQIPIDVALRPDHTTEQGRLLQPGRLFGCGPVRHRTGIPGGRRDQHPNPLDLRRYLRFLLEIRYDR